MAAKANVTKAANITVQAREIDFVTRFGRNWEALREVMGIMRPIKKEFGHVLKSKTASVTLQSGAVAEGDEIPYSLATVTEHTYAEMTLEKFRKGVTAEAIKTHGYDVAVAKTDDALLEELQNNVTTRFYTYLKTGTLNETYTTYQMALAMALGLVKDKFKKMHRTITRVVGFANTLDVYEYLGGANLTVQTAFGMDYVKNFMGYETLFITSEVERGQVIATPVENIVLYYVDPADNGFDKAGLEYTVDGETNLIGFHVEGNYGTAVSDNFAIMGMTLFAEYLDGISVVTFDPEYTPESGNDDTNDDTNNG